ncbi:hypothetical protein A2U01_0077830, partial [Trifolium medium]|nr:hypothetical protein [Trifolium medium]
PQWNANFIIPLRSKICPTRTSPFQTTKERCCVRMDRGMRADPPTFKEGTVRTSGLIMTKRRGGAIPLPRCRFRGRQCSPHPRDN